MYRMAPGNCIIILKGFGPNMKVICDILGNLLDIMELQNGNEADIIMYCSTDWFYEVNGLNFDYW